MTHIWLGVPALSFIFDKKRDTWPMQSDTSCLWIGASSCSWVRPHIDQHMKLDRWVS